MAQQHVTSELPASSAADISPFRMKPTALFVACLLLVVSSVQWRQGIYFSGGADPVVIAKAGLTLIAVAIAWLMPRQPGTWSRFRAAPVLWLAAYLTISVVGGILNGDALSSTVLALRVALMALALLLIVVSNSWSAVISAMASAMLLLAGFSAVTGLFDPRPSVRLHGGIPPLSPNEICLLVSLPVLLLFWKCVSAQASRFDYFALLTLLAIVWLTGSRTGLAALIVGSMLILVLVTRVSAPVLAALLIAIPGSLYLILFTPLVSEFIGRGGPESIATLNSRTIAWTAAINYPEGPSEMLFGSGLALKKIPVNAAYRSEQILDSTWLSALIQAGWLGLIVLALFALLILANALTLRPPERALVFSLAAMILASSVLESGVFDATPAFIIIFTMTVLAYQVRRVEEQAQRVPSQL